jgi:hypothetical protein
VCPPSTLVCSPLPSFHVPSTTPRPCKLHTTRKQRSRLNINLVPGSRLIALMRRTISGACMQWTRARLRVSTPFHLSPLRDIRRLSPCRDANYIRKIGEWLHLPQLAWGLVLVSRTEGVWLLLQGRKCVWCGLRILANLSPWSSRYPFIPEFASYLVAPRRGRWMEEG